MELARPRFGSHASYHRTAPLPWRRVLTPDVGPVRHRHSTRPAGLCVMGARPHRGRGCLAGGSAAAGQQRWHDAARREGFSISFSRCSGREAGGAACSHVRVFLPPYPPSITSSADYLFVHIIRYLLQGTALADLEIISNTCSPEFRLI